MCDSAAGLLTVDRTLLNSLCGSTSPNEFGDPVSVRRCAGAEFSLSCVELRQTPRFRCRKFRGSVPSGFEFAGTHQTAGFSSGRRLSGVRAAAHCRVSNTRRGGLPGNPRVVERSGNCKPVRSPPFANIRPAGCRRADPFRSQVAGQLRDRLISPDGGSIAALSVSVGGEVWSPTTK